MTVNENADHVIALGDERSLGYAEYGDGSGTPVFYFHGGGVGSRLMAQNLEKEAVNVGVRIIAPDRPGIGLSDFKPGRIIGDWPGDVRELANALGVERFAIVSESGGSPYAAACAAQIPESLTAVSIVSGVSPHVSNVTKDMLPSSRIVNWIAGRAPFWFARLIAAQMARTLRRNPDQFLAQLTNGMPDSDLLVSASPQYREVALRCFQEAFRQGTRGPAWDLRLYPRSWGVSLDRIPIEVQIWHGDLDRSAPPAMALYMERTIPKCRATFYPDEGHLSVLYNHSREILEKLITMH